MNASERNKPNIPVIHLGWAIGVLLLAITALVTYSPNGAVIRDYISFAAAISSIVLALVAIFYSMISNQGFSESVGSLRTSTSTLEETSVSLLLTAENISKGLADLGPRFDAIDLKIEKTLSPNIVTKKSSPKTNSGKLVLGTGNLKTAGLSASLYVLLKMHQTGKDFNPIEAFKSDIWRYYVAASLSSISYFRPMDISISRNSPSTYKLDSLGNVSEELLNSSIDFESFNKEKKNIDAYFDDGTSE